MTPSRRPNAFLPLLVGLAVGYGTLRATWSAAPSLALLGSCAALFGAVFLTALAQRRQRRR